MRIPLALMFVVLACAATTTPPARLIRSPVVIPENESQKLFDDAIQWSREHKLETGGCFKIFQVVGNKVIVIDAEERVVWRRPHWVQLDCAETDGIWHTHWQKEDTYSVGCNMNRARDLAIISRKSALGLVVCGMGKDSLVPYNYSADADQKHEAFLVANPDVAEQEEQARVEANRFRCADEPPASLKRGRIRCRP